MFYSGALPHSLFIAPPGGLRALPQPRPWALLPIGTATWGPCTPPLPPAVSAASPQQGKLGRCRANALDVDPISQLLSVKNLGFTESAFLEMALTEGAGGGRGGPHCSSWENGNKIDEDKKEISSGSFSVKQKR